MITCNACDHVQNLFLVLIVLPLKFVDQSYNGYPTLNEKNKKESQS